MQLVLGPYQSATTSGQSGPGSNGNEGVLCIHQSSSITGTLPSDCLESYLGYSLGEGLTPLQRCSWCILQPQPISDVLSLLLFPGQLWLTAVVPFRVRSLGQIALLKIIRDETTKIKYVINQNGKLKELYRDLKRQTKDIAHKITMTWLRRGNLKRETKFFLITAQNNKWEGTLKRSG